MCGIAGAFAYRESAQPVDDAEVVRMRDAMRQRGPDGAGLWRSPDGRAALGHRRLAIIDLSSAGAQPMASADGRFVIVFNGEIYNYKPLRERLIRQGAALRSHSDTEVILELYAREGEGALNALRGMFALAIWDTLERRLFMARDPFGIKPLYFADDGGTLRFASQVRALLHGQVDRAPDFAGHAGFWTWGFVPEPFTLYRAIQCLPAGCSVTVDARGLAPVRRHFDIASVYREAEASTTLARPEDCWERLGAALDDSVAHHLIADVPVGVFLSAGIDSTIVATLAARLGKGAIRGITLAAEEHRGGVLDESTMAAATAKRLKLAHDVEPLARGDFEESLVDVLDAMDQPTTDGINTYFVARAAARQGLKVAMSGLGADELFMGYPSFRDVPRIVRRFSWARRSPRLARALRASAAPLMARVASPKYAGLAEYGTSLSGAYLLRRSLFMPWELEDLMGGAQSREGWERLNTLPMLGESHRGIRDERCAVSALECAWYMRGQLLRDADWAGMAHSLEIRVPFVDVEVLRAAAPLAVRGMLRSKRDVAELRSLGLPRDVLDRPKTGFLMPVREWTQGRARGSRERGLRGWARKVSAHFAGRRSLLVLATDSFGASGGIALYMRDFIASMASGPSVERVTALPRHAPGPIQPLPAKVDLDLSGLGGKRPYAMALARWLRSARRPDVVVCGHVNLLPLAVPLAALSRAPLILTIYGIDAWSPTRSALANAWAGRADAVASISELTLRRFLSWSGVDPARCTILPNAIHREHYGVGPPSEALQQRYGLRGCRVIMSLGRLCATERYKGIDAVLDAMPPLLLQVPNLTYLVAGDGTDRERLQRKAASLGISDHVVFTGRLEEREKADHYRLADAFVMPSTGEGFGFVFLEAMACGIPVVASRTDGGREALRDGLLGRLVDPADGEELARAILEAIDSPKGVPPALAHFDFEHFERRCHRLLERTCLLN